MGNELKRFSAILAAVLLLISTLPAAALEEKEAPPKPALTIFILYAVGKSNTDPVMPGFYKITVPTDTAGIPEAEVLVKRDSFEATVTPKGAVEADARRIARDDMALTITGLKEGKARIGIAAFTSTYDNKKPLYSQFENVMIETGGSQAILVPEDLKTPPKVYDSYTEAMNAVMEARKDSFNNNFLIPAQEPGTVSQNIIKAMSGNEKAEKNGAVRFVLAYPFGPAADFSVTPDFYQITLQSPNPGEPDIVFGVNRSDKKIDKAQENIVCYLSNGLKDDMFFDVFGVPSGKGTTMKVSTFPIGAATGPVLLEGDIKIDVPAGGMLKVTIPPGPKNEITAVKGTLSDIGYAGEDMAVAVAAAKLKPEDLVKPDWLLASDTIETSVIGLDWNVSKRESVIAKIEGSPSAATAGSSVTLSASSESAKNSLKWRQIAGSPVVISNPGAAKITFIPKEPGVYSFLLEASSGDVSNFDFATINVVGKKTTAAPKPAGSMQLKDPAGGMFLYGNLLLVPSDNGALIDSYEISDPLKPSLRKRFLLPVEGDNKILLGTAMAGNLFFTVSGVFSSAPIEGPAEYSPSLTSGYISIYRFLPEEKLEIAGMLDVDSDKPSVSIDGKYAYVTSGTETAKLDLSVPFPSDNPVFFTAGSNNGLPPAALIAIKQNLPGDAVPLTAWDTPGGRCLLTASKGKKSIEIYNAGNAEKTEKTGSAPMSFAPADTETNARVFGGTAIVWPAKNTAADAGTCEVVILDVSDPSKPSGAGSIKIDGECPSEAVLNNNILYLTQSRKLLFYQMN